MTNTEMTTDQTAAAAGKRNTRVALICASVAIGMVGMAYASVPLYRLFCQVTGFGGTTQRVEKPSTEVIDKTVTVRFDANVGPGFAWDFQPVVRTIDVKIGENALIFYRATNRSDRPLVGTATFNVTPDQVGSFFNKVACFCFTEQRLEPGETIEMPVSFFVDPAIVQDPDGSKVRNITLSYTFFPVDKPRSAKTETESTQPATPPG